MMNEVYRSIFGEMRNLQRENDFLFSVELWLLNDATNRNKWRFENLEQHRKSFANIPVLVAYVDGGRTIGSGHNFSIEIDPATGEERADFRSADAERICGATSYRESDIRIAERDGNKWIVAKAYLWRWYSAALVDKIEDMARQGRAMSLSIEAVVLESHMDGDTEVETSYLPLGVTLLGDGVEPAVVGARVEMLRAMRKDFDELCLRAASYQEKEKEQKPRQNSKGVKKLSQISKSQLLELSKRFEGWTALQAVQDDEGIHVALRSDGWDFARYTMQSLDETIMPERIERTRITADFGWGLEIDVIELTEGLFDEVGCLKAASEKSATELAAANATIATLREQEATRRLSAAKDKAKATLESFNLSRMNGAKIDEKVLEPIVADIEAGVYTNCVDAEGKWTGESDVETRVYAACAKEVQGMDMEAMRASQKSYIFEQGAAAQRDPDSIEAIYASIVG